MNSNGGTCFMKTGFVSRSDAIFTDDVSMECGIPSGKIRNLSSNYKLKFFILK